MPPGTDLTLALVLTAGGATAAAALIVGLIALLKNLGGIGSWLEAGHEPIVAFVLSAALVILAAVNVGVHDLAGAFAAFLAWYGIATLSFGIHDTAGPILAPSAP